MLKYAERLGLLMDDITRLYEKDCVKIGLFGVGRSTVGALEYLLKAFKFKEISVTVRCDEEVPRYSLPIGLKNCRLMCGRAACERINEDLIILSPSVRGDRPELTEAKKKGTVITSDAEIFFAANGFPVLAVTGSDGKSTTSKIAHALLGGDESGARLCGNIGAAMSPLLLDKRGKIFVTELSSFMLNSFSPKVTRGTVTNITPNHLNWHTSLTEYVLAKENILKNAAERVLWADGDISEMLIRKYAPDTVISYDKGYKELMSYVQAKSYVTKDCSRVLVNGEEYCNIGKLERLGEHTVRNFMNALGLTIGYTDKTCAQSVADGYEPLPHRCESVGVYRGVEYINSSIDSTPLRTATTLNSLKREVTLILCGRGKGLSYAPLEEPLKRYVKRIVVCGEIRGEVLEFLNKIGIDSKTVYTADSFKECVRVAARITESGTVLFSPSATSFDEFKSFEERGDAFKRYIKERNGT